MIRFFGERVKKEMRLLITAVFTAFIIIPSLSYGDKAILDFDDDIILRSSFHNKNLQFSILLPEGNPRGGSDAISYKPNTGFNAGIDLSWRGFGFSYVRTLKGTEEEKSLYGETEFTDYQFYSYGQKICYDIYYQKYSGFFLNNAEDHLLSYKTDSETRRRDMSIKNAGINLYYVFSHEFSLAASFKQTRKQLKSGGSFLVALSLNSFIVKGGYSLIPLIYEEQFDNYRGYREGEYRSAGISPGYIHTLIIFDDLYITAGAFAGSGIMNKKFTVSSGEKKSTDLFYKLNIRGSMGYNSRRLFAGIQLIGDFTRTTFATDRSEINAGVSSSLFEIFAGVRI